MIYLSVCSGIEAATAAWQPLGWKAAFFAQHDPEHQGAGPDFASLLLKHYYPAVPNLGDITKFKEWPDADIDVLVGGTPCQSFSVAGLRKGLADPRGNLTLTYLAIAARYRPQWLVWENVPGVLSDRTGAFGAFLGGLGELGYGFAYRILDAQYCGVPQRRRRVFVVGYLGDWRCAAAVLFERHSLQGHIAPGRQTREGLAAGAARSVAVRGRDGTPQAELGDDKANAILTPNGGRCGAGVGAIIAPTLSTRGRRGGGDFDCDGGLVHQIAKPVLAGGHANNPIDENLICMSSGQANAEVAEDVSTTLTTLHEAPIVTTHQRVTNELRADGFDASEDGTGRVTPIIPILEVGKGSSSRGVGPNSIGIGIDGDPMYTLQAGAQHAVAFTQNQRDEVRTMEVAGALAGEPGMKQQTYIAFSAKDSGADASADIAPTLRAGGHSKSHANAGVMPAIAFDCKAGGKTGFAIGDVHGALRGDGHGGGHAAIQSRMMVRRLTPRECERLQGFPDDFTLIPVKAVKRSRLLSPRAGYAYREIDGVVWQLAADGPRYRALGNSMAVPCMAWLGQRIALVAALIKELSK